MTASSVLTGARVGVTARHGGRLVQALEQLGALVTWAPTFDVVSVPDERVRAETRAALSASPGAVVVTTGTGLDRWVEGAGAVREELLGCLRTVTVAARGEGSRRACAAHGCPPDLVVSAERMAHLVPVVLDRAGNGAAVVAQVDGGGSPALVDALAAAGVVLRTVRPRRWTLPADHGRARALVRSVVAGAVDVLTFTSPPSVDGLFEVAAELGLAAEVRERLVGPVKVAVVGPATAEAAEGHGATVAVCPSRPRVDALVAALANTGAPVPAVSVTLDPARRHAVLAGRAVALSDLEFALLAALARRPGATCSTETLLREVWGERAPKHRLEALVSRLRARLACDDVAIVAVHKRGYRLEAAGRS